jgi:hypothetical protein
MSKSSGSFGTVIRIMFLILLALITLREPGLVLIFLVPIVGWLIWRDQDRIAELERKLTALEKPNDPKPDQS